MDILCSWKKFFLDREKFSLKFFVPNKISDIKQNAVFSEKKWRPRMLFFCNKPDLRHLNLFFSSWEQKRMYRNFITFSSHMIWTQSYKYLQFYITHHQRFASKIHWTVDTKVQYNFSHKHTYIFRKQIYFLGRWYRRTLASNCTYVHILNVSD